VAPASFLFIPGHQTVRALLALLGVLLVAYLCIPTRYVAVKESVCARQ
jgi:hypothetical protein